MLICETQDCHRNNVDHGVKFSWSAGKYLCLEHDVYRSSSDMGINYYQKQTIGYDGKDAVRMSAAEHSDIVSRKVNPDGSVSKKQRSYIDLGLERRY